MVKRKPLNNPGPITSPNSISKRHLSSIRSQLWCGGCLLVLLAGGIISAFSAADRPAKGTTHFGYGARLDLSGYLSDSALELASSMGLEWVAIPFDWAGIWPDPSDPPDLATLDRIMDLARQKGISVLLSLSNAPTWAITGQGPDPNLTAELLMNLGARYPALGAVEPFPGANTRAGWGTQPDPTAYGNLLITTQGKLGDLEKPPLLVAGGLTPLSPSLTDGDVDDLAFLKSLYEGGFSPALGIVSIQFHDLVGNPLTPSPETGSQVLRHFESVRKLMLDSGNRDEMIWVTSFSWPSGKISQGFQDPESQAQWLHQAYNLFSAQLYIGAAFFDQLNPPNRLARQNPEIHSLIDPAGNLHPGLRSLELLTSYEEGSDNPGSAKKLVKKLYTHKNRIKPDL